MRLTIASTFSGVGGIDLALLVIAADEGVMPQTREHLAILDLLRVPAAVVTATVQGEVIFAVPSITSTPKPV